MNAAADIFPRIPIIGTRAARCNIREVDITARLPLVPKQSRLTSLFRGERYDQPVRDYGATTVLHIDQWSTNACYEDSIREPAGTDDGPKPWYEEAE